MNANKPLERSGFAGRSTPDRSAAIQWRHGEGTDCRACRVEIRWVMTAIDCSGFS